MKNVHHQGIRGHNHGIRKWNGLGQWLIPIILATGLISFMILDLNQ
jgi:hypothetical protein